MMAAAGVFSFSMPGCASCLECKEQASGRGATPDAAGYSNELPDLHRAGLEQQWQRQVKLSSGERIRKVWRVGQSVYVSTTDSRFVRIDAKTGVLKWNQGLGSANFEVFKPIELKNIDGRPENVLVVTRGEVFTFNMDTGDEAVPPQSLGVSVSCDPVVVGNTLCVGGAGMYYGLYLDRPQIRRWVVPARGDAFVAAPVAVDANVLTATGKGELRRISTETGDWDWRDRKTNGPVLAGLIADFNALYVASMDQRVYAFRTDSGGELWETQLSGRLEDTPTAAGPVIVVKAVNNGIFALARSNGDLKWRAEDVHSVATATDDHVWVADTAGNLKSLDVNDGDVLAIAPAPGVAMFVPNTVDKSVVLVTHGGLIGIYNETKGEPPKEKKLDEPAAMR